MATQAFRAVPASSKILTHPDSALLRAAQLPRRRISSPFVMTVHFGCFCGRKGSIWSSRTGSHSTDSRSYSFHNLFPLSYALWWWRAVPQFYCTTGALMSAGPPKVNVVVTNGEGESATLPHVYMPQGCFTVGNRLLGVWNPLFSFPRSSPQSNEWFGRFEVQSRKMDVWTFEAPGLTNFVLLGIFAGQALYRPCPSLTRRVAAWAHI